MNIRMLWSLTILVPWYAYAMNSNDKTEIPVYFKIFTPSTPEAIKTVYVAPGKTLQETIALLLRIHTHYQAITGIRFDGYVLPANIWHMLTVMGDEKNTYLKTESSPAVPAYAQDTPIAQDHPIYILATEKPVPNQ